jgi:hypothetical protein
MSAPHLVYAKTRLHVPPPVELACVVGRERVGLLRERARRGQLSADPEHLVLVIEPDSREQRERGCRVRHPSEALGLGLGLVWKEHCTGQAARRRRIRAE